MLGLLVANYQDITGFSSSSQSPESSLSGRPYHETPVVLEKTYTKCGHTIIRSMSSRID